MWPCLLFQYGNPSQGKNVSEGEYKALSDSIAELKFLLPECEEYKEELPLPRFLLQHEQQQIRQHSQPPPKKGRAESDAVTDEDWAKLDSMVFITIYVFRIPIHVSIYLFRGPLLNISLYLFRSL